MICMMMPVIDMDTVTVRSWSLDSCHTVHTISLLPEFPIEHFIFLKNSQMEDTSVKLSVDLSSRVLQQFNKFSHKANITIDIGPNIILAVKYLAGSLILFKTIDVSCS